MKLFPHKCAPLFGTLLLGSLSLILADKALAADAPRVYFVSPKNGAEVASPVNISMGISGMTVAPAGEVKEGQGHHHLIVDGGPSKQGDIVPADATHIHFGKGQTAASVPLAPGKHKLTLQFADGAHRSLGEQMSETIEVLVK